MARPERHKTPLAQRLTEVRKALGHDNRAPFAELLGVPLETLANYERGDRDPPLNLLSTYHTRFGINLSWLLTSEGTMFDDPAKAAVRELNGELFDRLARAADEVYREMKRAVPPVRMTGQVVGLYNELVALGINVDDAEAVEAAVPLLQLNLRRRLEQAAADPLTDKRRA